MECKDCKYAMKQGKNIHCTCAPIRSFTYTGNDILCKEFSKKSVDKKKIVVVK